MTGEWYTVEHCAGGSVADTLWTEAKQGELLLSLVKWDPDLLHTQILTGLTHYLSWMLKGRANCC